MLAARRQELIRRHVDRSGGARVRELSELLDVSAMTIRRDIDALAARNQIARVHGGAAAIPRPETASSDDPGFAVKSRLQFVEKGSIARRAAELIKPGNAIGITAGTTSAMLANELREIPDLLVVTNSLPATATLHQAPRRDLTVIVTGGSPTPSQALVGPMAERSLDGLHLDLLFMGVHGMSEATGFTSPSLLEAQTLQAFINAAETVVVMADHTKWGTIGLSTIAQLSEADVLVTNSGMPAPALTALQAEVGEVITADVGVVAT